MRKPSDSNKKLLERFKYRCIICFKRYSALHHIIPRSVGGEDNSENKVPLCQSCHRRVHNLGALNMAKELTNLRKKRLKQLEIPKSKI